MCQLSIYSCSTSNARVYSWEETVLDGAPWRQIRCDIAVPFGVQLTTKRKGSIGRIIYHMTHMPTFSFPLFFREWSVFTWAHGWACHSSEFTDLEPRPVGIANISLISKIMLEMAAEQKKQLLNLVTNYGTNRNVHLALNKSREKDLCKRKNFGILSIWYCSWPVLFSAISFFADYATVIHMFYVHVLDYNQSVFLILRGDGCYYWTTGKDQGSKKQQQQVKCPWRYGPSVVLNNCSLKMFSIFKSTACQQRVWTEWSRSEGNI